GGRQISSLLSLTCNIHFNFSWVPINISGLDFEVKTGIENTGNLHTIVEQFGAYIHHTNTAPKGNPQAQFFGQTQKS
ncbi:hypothetical protein KI387_001197, partial [Taxus chinensis]